MKSSCGVSDWVERLRRRIFPASFPYHALRQPAFSERIIQIYDIDRMMFLEDKFDIIRGCAKEIWKLSEADAVTFSDRVASVKFRISRCSESAELINSPLNNDMTAERKNQKKKFESLKEECL